MNKLLSLLALVLFVGFISSCDEETAAVATVVDNGKPSMTAKLNGNAWTAFDGGFAGQLDSTGSLLITGVGAVGSDTVIILLATEAPQGGPFAIDTLDSNDNGAAINLLDAAVSGSINITAHNANTKLVSGTFNFKTEGVLGSTAYDVTDGQFKNVVYTNQ